MAPAPASQPRRSARLGSQTPSITEKKEPAHASTRVQARKTAAAFDLRTAVTHVLRGDRAFLHRLTKPKLEAVIHALVERDAESQQQIGILHQRLERTTAECDQRIRDSTMNRRKMDEIMRKHAEKKKIEAATHPTDVDPSPPSAPAAATPQAASPRPVTPPDAIIPSPAAAPSTSIWGSLTSFITSSFSSKKRKAEDEPAAPEPIQKRQRPTEAMTEPKPKPKRPAEPVRPARKQTKTTYTSAATSPFVSSSTQSQEKMAAEPAEPAEPSPTPPESLAGEEPQMPPPQSAPSKEQPLSTPRPKRKRLNSHAAVATPLPAIVESSPKRFSALQTITPRPRTVASARAAQSARKAPQSVQPDRRYVWEQKPPAAKEPNADARIAKIRRAEQLRRELAELEQEEDILRRTKRVKVDHLAEIPHNRPGDSASTFRVPDIDSDDEMEVYDEVEERPNVFSTSKWPPATTVETPTPSTQHTAAPLPPPPSSDATLQPVITPTPQAPQLPAQHATSPLPSASATEQQTPAQTLLAPPIFNFPSVAPRPADYWVSEDYKNEAGDIFSTGFAAYKAQQAIGSPS